MKKTISLILVFTLAFGMTINAGATQTITFDDSGNGTVTNKEAEATPTPTPEPTKAAEEGGITAIIDSIFGGSSDSDKIENKGGKKGDPTELSYFS